MKASKEVGSVERTRLCKVGKECHLIGIDVVNMDRVDMVAAIGFLNERVVSLMCGDEKCGFKKEDEHEKA